MGESEKPQFHQMTLTAYKQLIRLFLRYVLIRCAIYTNTRKQAERLAKCAFKEMWQRLEEFDSIGQAGDALSATIDSTAEQYAQAPTQTENMCGLTETEMLVTDNKIQQLAHEMNAIGDIPQQMLVLHHLEMLSLKEISIIYKKTIRDVKSIITTSEKALADKLSLLWKPQIVAADDICLWLDNLGKALEPGLRECIAKSILDSVSGPENHPA